MTPNLFRRLAACRLRLRQAFCSHRFYNDDVKRINAGLVRCPCFKCEKVCEATYGLALDGSFVGYRPKVGDTPWRVPDKRPPPGAMLDLGPDEPAPVYPQSPAAPSNDDLASLFADLLTEALDELFEVTRDPDRQRSDTEAVRKSIKWRADAAIAGAVSFDPQPLTADEVRQIVREEIERASDKGIGQ